ncbi:hypothetical protein LCGC14_0768030 [marine sediment metagenome]|uniref:Uncharacterized protein n=1 Tax=marine sediment metagenome TaxID=412755 RepID=A0A0F9QIZ4_9ZZZZ
MPEQVRIHGAVDVGLGEQGAPAPNMVAITYSTSDVPPRTVFVDKDKDTAEERQRVIKEDLEAARAAGAERFELP